MFTARRRAARQVVTTVVTAAVLAVLAGCTDGGDDSGGTGLDAAAVADLAGTAEVVAAVAAEGVREEGARPAAVVVARDAATFADIVDERYEVGLQFMGEILAADPDALPILVAAALDALVLGFHDTAVALTGLDPDHAGRLGNQRFYAAGSAHRNFFGLLGRAARDAGVDNEELWAALLGVLDPAQDAGAATGSFVSELDDAELDGLARHPDPPDVPADEAAFSAGTEHALVSLLTDAFHAEPEARELLTGDEDISRDAFAEHPIVAVLLDVHGRAGGRAGLRALSDLIGDENSINDLYRS